VKLERGGVYTRKQIAEGLGGIGTGILPLKDGEVAAGLFDLATNAMTHLTGEIEVFPKTLPKAAKTGDTMPVFIKISALGWRYAGEYVLEAIDKGKRAKESVGREDVAGVLRFRPTKPQLKLVKGK
jgi:hypothetical protein